MSLTASLRWESVIGSDSYEVEVRDGAGNIVFSENLNTLSLHLNPEMQPSGKVFPVNDLSGGHRCSWRVRALFGKIPGLWSDPWTFTTPMDCDTGIDGDCDGIPDTIESSIFQTNPGKKTLFVRPGRRADESACKEGREGFFYSNKLGACLSYWEDFYADIFPESRNGRAAIPAFDDAGIEVVVLGAGDNSSESFRGMVGFRYRPEEHPDWPCDILEVVADATGPPEGYGGHAFFSGNRWTWSPMGHSSGVGYHGEYGVAVVYLYSVDRYFTDGAYQKIAVGEGPKTTDCRRDPRACSGLNPNNLNDGEVHLEAPFYALPDDTVEFNEIDFDGEGVIRKIGKRGRPYTKKEVYARILVHEMGHALLGLRHCRNPSCVLYQETRNWDHRLFGPICPDAEKEKQRCLHSPGERRDIRRPGVIHNQRHPSWE